MLVAECSASRSPRFWVTPCSRLTMIAPQRDACSSEGPGDGPEGGRVQSVGRAAAAGEDDDGAPVVLSDERSGGEAACSAVVEEVPLVGSTPSHAGRRPAELSLRIPGHVIDGGLDTTRRRQWLVPVRHLPPAASDMTGDAGARSSTADSGVGHVAWAEDDV